MFNKKLKNRIKYLEEVISDIDKKIGTNNSLYHLSYNHIKRTIAYLDGEKFEENEVNLNEVSIAERLKKIEDYLKIKYTTESFSGYKKTK